MSSRTARRLAAGGLCLALAAAISAVAPAPAEAREMVRINFSAAPGTIVVRTSERSLYLIKPGGQALRYRVAVGQPSKQWTGQTVINGKHIRPAWSPPAVVRRDKPSLPDVIPGGSPSNPMGAAALTLAGGEYAIHGTNVPNSIGRAVSYGCIRMHNEDVLDLYGRVSVGTPVVVIR